MQFKMTESILLWLVNMHFRNSLWKLYGVYAKKVFINVRSTKHVQRIGNEKCFLRALNSSYGKMCRDLLGSYRLPSMTNTLSQILTHSKMYHFWNISSTEFNWVLQVKFNFYQSHSQFLQKHLLLRVQQNRFSEKYLGNWGELLLKQINELLFSTTDNFEVIFLFVSEKLLMIASVSR